MGKTWQDADATTNARIDVLEKRVAELSGEVTIEPDNVPTGKPEVDERQIVLPIEGDKTETPTVVSSHVRTTKETPSRNGTVAHPKEDGDQ